MSLTPATVVALRSDEAAMGPAQVHEGLTIHEAALAVLKTQHAAILANEGEARAGGEEPLHDMRVAVRRMRAGMGAFRDFLPAKARAMRRSLGWLGSALGEVRDHDVHLEQIAAWMAGASPSEQRGLVVVERTLVARRVAARGRLLRALDSQRRTRLFASIEDMLLHGPAPRAVAARALIVDAAPDVVARRYSKVRSLGDAVTPFTQGETLHALRIRAKRLRYVVEFFTPLYGKPARSFAKRVVTIQDLLGRHQDAIVSGAMLAELVESSSPDAAAAFSIGRLAERHDREATEARQQLPDAYRAITGKRWRALQRAMDERRSAASPPRPETAG